VSVLRDSTGERKAARHVMKLAGLAMVRLSFTVRLASQLPHSTTPAVSAIPGSSPSRTLATAPHATLLATAVPARSPINAESASHMRSYQLACACAKKDFTIEMRRIAWAVMRRAGRARVRMLRSAWSVGLGLLIGRGSVHVRRDISPLRMLVHAGPVLAHAKP
jgi:hypothetical protein